MDFVSTRPTGVFDSLVMLFQVVGLTSLLLARLLPRSRWLRYGRTLFVVALVGLCVAGSICAHERSNMGLFAGGTFTFLLVGMIAGSHGIAPAVAGPTREALGTNGAV
jgi:hypothetical protein